MGPHGRGHNRGQMVAGTRDISVVIPTFNRATQVCAALRSVLSQTCHPGEIIVVDDGSTDDTTEALGQFGGHIRLVRQANKGGAAARNLGVSQAAHPWIAFLDSDDVWEPEHLERIATVIDETDGAADLYFDNIRKPQEEGGRTKWEIAGFSPTVPYEVAEDGTSWVLMADHPMMLQASVVRVAAFRAAGGFWEDLRTAHDTHFFMKLCIGRPVCAVFGVGARQTNAGAAGTGRLTAKSGPAREDRRRNIVRLHRDILERYPNLAPPHRAVVRKRLAAAHWRLSRIAWGNRAYQTWFEELIAAVTTDPLVVGRRLSFGPGVAEAERGTGHRLSQSK